MCPRSVLELKTGPSYSMKINGSQPHTCSCGFAQPSSFGTIHKKPESPVPPPVTRNMSPPATPGHHDWLMITFCDSFGSCTHELKTFESPTLRSAGGAGLLKIDVEV